MPWRRAGPRARRRDPDIRVRDWSAQADRLHAAIMSGDETLARHIFARLARGVPLTELCERVIAPALYRIGEDWAAGAGTTIATEHRASAICERLIAARTRQPQGRPRGIAVVSTPPGERHGLPALMATACLREDRWLVHHLASDLPVAEVTGLARQAGASLVVLSAATRESARLAREVAPDITRSAAGLHVLTGQPGDPLSRLRQLARATHGRRPWGRRRPSGQGQRGGEPESVSRSRAPVRGRSPRRCRPVVARPEPVVHKPELHVRNLPSVPSCGWQAVSSQPWPSTGRRPGRCASS